MGIAGDQQKVIVNIKDPSSNGESAEFTLCPTGTPWCRQHTPEGCLGPAYLLAENLSAWLCEPVKAADGDRCTLVIEDASGQVTELSVRL